MSNARIRDAAKKNSVKLWQVAKAIGISDFTLSRRLRRELPEAEQEKIMGIINDLAKEAQQ